MLEGERHVHLGLVLTTEEYKTVAHGTPYIKSTLPVLIADIGETKFQLAPKRYKYDKAMLTYRESIVVDRILIQQIVNAIEDNFLKHFVITLWVAFHSPPQ